MPKSERPNVVLLMSDTVRCDLLGCMGGIPGVTPNIDRLASEGMLFGNAHSCSPVCGPARCSLITGVYPQVHQAFENGFARLDNLPALPDVLKEQGYRNIMVGKTHFGRIPDSFDIVYPAPGNITKLTHRTESFTGGEEDPELLGTDGDWTTRFIEELRIAKDGDVPFFAFCSLNSPHDPLDPPGRFRTKFSDTQLPPVNYTVGEEDRQPQLLRKLLGIKDGETLEAYPGLGASQPFNAAQGAVYDKTLNGEIEAFRRLYCGYMAYSDALIGRILDYLESSGLAENTLVVYTSDHGQSYFDHGFNDKHNFYDETFRVPLIMRLPGVIPAGGRRGFAVTTDVTASILGAAGASCDTMSGFDLFTPIAEGKPNPRNCAVGTLCGYIALATERYKLEYYPRDDVGRLFDRENDAAEQTDLYGDERYRAVRETMLKALLTWYANTGNLHFLRTHRAGAGGPVAIRSRRYINGLSGLDSERLLEKQILGIPVLPL